MVIVDFGMRVTSNFRFYNLYVGENDHGGL